MFKASSYFFSLSNINALSPKAKEEDDEATNTALDEENDGWYGGPKDSEEIIELSSRIKNKHINEQIFYL